jgi:hypothetical protein
MQETLVFLLVAAAIAYLARQVWLSLRGKKSCCESGCGKVSTHKKSDLVQISLNGKTLPVQKNSDSKSSLN